MLKNPPQKGDKPKVRKLVMNIEEDLLRQLKIRAAEQMTTVREIVTDAVKEALQKGGTTTNAEGPKRPAPVLRPPKRA
jgi:hypothetical protein